MKAKALALIVISIAALMFLVSTSPSNALAGDCQYAEFTGRDAQLHAVVEICGAGPGQSSQVRAAVAGGQVGHVGFCNTEGSCAFRSPDVNTFEKGHSCLSYTITFLEDHLPLASVILEAEIPGQLVFLGEVPIADEPPPGGLAKLGACG